jgi:hypothetical protein
MTRHPATVKLPPVAALTAAELRRIVGAAPVSRLAWTPREKDAWRELERREARA